MHMFSKTNLEDVFIVLGCEWYSHKLRDKFELGFCECIMHMTVIRPKVNEVNNLGYYST